MLSPHTAAAGPPPAETERNTSPSPGNARPLSYILSTEHFLKNNCVSVIDQRGVCFMKGLINIQPIPTECLPRPGRLPQAVVTEANEAAQEIPALAIFKREPMENK